MRKSSQTVGRLFGRKLISADSGSSLNDTPSEGSHLSDLPPRVLGVGAASLPWPAHPRPHTWSHACPCRGRTVWLWGRWLASVHALAFAVLVQLVPKKGQCSR